MAIRPSDFGLRISFGFRFSGFGFLILSCVLRSAEEDDAVRVGALGHVAHTPAIRGLGELLIVDEHEHGFEARRDAAGQNGFLHV